MWLSYFLFLINGFRIGFKSQIQMSCSSWSGADCVITNLPFGVAAITSLTDRDCRVGCRAGTNVVPSFGSGALPGLCSWKITCGICGQRASLDGSLERGKKNPKLCQSRVNRQVKLGDLSFTFLPSDPISVSPLLCAGPCAYFWKRNIFYSSSS